MGQPHELSESVSALQQNHKARVIQALWKARTKAKIPPPIDPTTVPKTTILHLDYTGALPDRCASGTLLL
jgi:hypothetical protein